MTGNRASNTMLRTLRLGLVPVTRDCCVVRIGITPPGLQPKV